MTTISCQALKNATEASRRPRTCLARALQSIWVDRVTRYRVTGNRTGTKIFSYMIGEVYVSGDSEDRKLRRPSSTLKASRKRDLLALATLRRHEDRECPKARSYGKDEIHFWAPSLGKCLPILSA